MASGSMCTVIELVVGQSASPHGFRHMETCLPLLLARQSVCIAWGGAVNKIIPGRFQELVTISAWHAFQSPELVTISVWHAFQSPELVTIQCVASCTVKFALRLRTCELELLLATWLPALCWSGEELDG